MPRNSGPAKRDMFPSHGAGKGDADRSPGWRERYDEIEWPTDHYVTTHAFHKTYGPAAPTRLNIVTPDYRDYPTESESLNREIEKIIDESDAKFIQPAPAFSPGPVNYNEGYKCQE